MEVSALSRRSTPHHPVLQLLLPMSSGIKVKTPIVERRLSSGSETLMQVFRVALTSMEQCTTACPTQKWTRRHQGGYEVHNST